MTAVPTTTETLVVSEIFGPTVQGEGPSLGRRASFIRLGGCNLSCSWCDTPYTWDSARHDLRTELARLPVDQIAARALADAPGLVVITGGEPLLHQTKPGWTTLLDTLTAAGVDIEVETNGTQAPTEATTGAVTRFNASPKLTHAGDPEPARINPEAITTLHATGKAVYKFVCRTPEDVQEAARHTTAWGVPPHLVWIMPEGTTPAALGAHLAEIADPAVTAGFNVTTRLHVLAWGDERAR